MNRASHRLLWLALPLLVFATPGLPTQHGPLVLALSPLPSPLFPAPQLAPQLTIENECTAMAFAPDGKLVYAVRRIISRRRIDMQRDDIWLLPASPAGAKPRRIVDGEKLVRSPVPYSYAIQSLRWSPDGTKLTVEMLTSQMVDERGTTEEGSLTLLLDETGKEIKIQGADSIIPEGSNGAWLGDGVTVAYLAEAVKPRLLFSVRTIRPVSGRGAQLFEKHTFAAVAWHARASAAAAVERDPELKEPPKLVWLDLVKETRRELAKLEGYVGQLSVSPSGEKIAYFRSPETLEIRRLSAPGEALQVKMPFGPYQWAPDESRLLVMRGVSPAVPQPGVRPSRRSGDLVWVRLPDGHVEAALRTLTFRDFELAPTGRSVAVTEPGRRHLLIYSLE
jgi:hypothetical protein